MMRLGEMLVFGSVAAGLHVAAFAGWPGDPPGDGPAAPGAPQAVAVRAADPALAALVESWDRPPSAATAAPAPEQVAPATRAPTPSPVDGAVPVQVPRRDDRIRSDPAARQSPPDPPVARRPAPRPEPAPKVSASLRGAAGLEAAPPVPPKPEAAETEELKLGFGAEVRSALAAALVYPEAAVSRGLAGVPTLEVQLDRGGGLLAARIARSSGSAMLDGAALRTARAARYPAAPEALPGTSFAFSVPLRYQLR